MQIYKVGGAVRDSLLGLTVKDIDYVVVGASPEQMTAAGFRPVGKDFPVFLHPKTQHEYALARTERKTAKGYKGFEIYSTPEVSLEQDLARRDFTINAIAQGEDGCLIDPYHGQRDLETKQLRHISPAFSEDPVRILRAARFMARFTQFSIADETMLLMRDMVSAGEVNALVAERVWQEIAKGLMEKTPSRMFETLRTCGALKVILPELEALWGVPQTAKYHPEVDAGIHVMLAIDYAAKQHYDLAVRFATLTHDLGKGNTPKNMLPSHIGHEQRSVELLKGVCQRLRVPKYCKELAQLVAKYHGKMHSVLQMKASTLLHFLQELDAFRQQKRFIAFLQACECDSRGRTGLEQCELVEAERLQLALQRSLSVNTKALAQQYSEPEQIKQAIFDARLAQLVLPTYS